MNENETKSSLVKVLALASFGLAAGAGITGSLCGIDTLGKAVQANCAILALICGVVAMLLAMIALVRIAIVDAKGVFLPAMAALFLSIYGEVMLARWVHQVWKKGAEAHRTQTIPAAVPSPQAVQSETQPISEPATSKLKYEWLALNAIPERVKQIRNDASKQTGEDAAMLRAWATHLEKFYALYTNTMVTSNKLHKIDLLDLKLIHSFGDSEPIHRRGLANDYADAWRKLYEATFTFSGSFYQDMQTELISPDRMSAEAQALSAFVREPETASKIALLQRVCQAEEQVGRGYNYTVSAVFDYARITSRMPKPGPQFREHMDEQLQKLKASQEVAARSRIEASAIF